MTSEFERKQNKNISRLTNQTFQFDDQVKQGFFSAEYFLKTQKILESKNDDKRNDSVLIQFFQRHSAMLCGIDEVIALIHTFAHNPEQLEIHALNDGDIISPFEPVLTIKGNYAAFGYLEGIIDGILARRTSVATNAYQYTSIANVPPIIFMGDREDYFFNQIGDGYACKIGGIHLHATDAMGSWFQSKGIGTMPHTLIQSYQGNLIAACQAYLDTFPDSPLTALVDYNNDVITDSIAVACHFGKKLHAVRVDTSPNMVDQYFLSNPQLLGSFDPRGINPKLVFALRNALNDKGFQHVKIIASGNFDIVKFSEFITQKVPVDSYGIGSSLLKINIGFTGDCVLFNDKPCAKAGRAWQPNLRLHPVPYPI